MALCLCLALLQNQLDTLLQGDGHRVSLFRQRDELVVVTDVGTETTGADHHHFILELAHGARQFEEIQRLFQGDGGHRLSLLHLSKARLLLVVYATNLYHRAEAADLHRYGLLTHRVGTQDALAHFMLLFHGHGLLHQRLELAVELLHQAGPLLLTLGHLIELFLDVCREVIIHNLGEVLQQEVVDHRTDVGRKQLTLLAAGQFRAYLLFDLIGF